MQRKTALPLAILVAVALLAVWGFSSIMGRRYSSGEAYPPYSSLRSDPLGTRALFDSLDRLDGIGVERNYLGLRKLEGGPGRTLMLLHVHPEMMDDRDEINGTDIRAFAVNGGRVVLTLDGQVSGWDKMKQKVEDRRKENEEKEKQERREKRRQQRKEKEQKEAGKEPPAEPQKAAGDKPVEDQKRSGKARNDEDSSKNVQPLREVLGITFEQRNFVMTAKGGETLKRAAGLPLKDEALPTWYSKTALKFEYADPESSKPASKAGPEAGKNTEDRTDKVTTVVDPSASAAKVLNTAEKWTVLATAAENGAVMLAERRFGQGSVIVATDSYFVSNEALLKERAPVFLAWLVGNARQVIFDETHLGASESPGIMTLARRLHLEGFFLGGLVLFGLFIWQSSSSLVPSQDQGEGEGSNVVAGHGAAAGLMSLLRRGIPRSQLLTRCIEVWEKSARHAGTSSTRIAAAEKVVASVRDVRIASRQVPGIYQQLCNAIHGNRKPPANP